MDCMRMGSAVRTALLVCDRFAPVLRFVPPVSGSEMACELEFTIPESNTFFDDKV